MPTKPTQKKSKVASKKTKNLEWNLTLLYKSIDDLALESDMQEIERLLSEFAKKYNKPEKTYLKDETKFLAALTEYETLSGKATGKPILYLHYRLAMNSADKAAEAKMALYSNRLTEALNNMQFFGISLGKIAPAKQHEFLTSKKLAHFKVFLERAFADAKHLLTEPEEKILALKRLPAQDLWIQANQKILGSKTISWKGRETPISEATAMVPDLEKASERKALWHLVRGAQKENAAFAEAELNAVVTDKKIDDQLRGHREPFDATIKSYRNDPVVIKTLIETVSRHFSVAHRFYRLKARMMGVKKLEYQDRNAKTGVIKRKFPVTEAIAAVEKAFDDIDPKFGNLLRSFIKNGQI
ncbi:MAG: hypothetical protein KGJ35_03265, partial [Patescibacteria group bacterium]|nr:hypothetical protein [Patescibacteria group bacterium]